MQCKQHVRHAHLIFQLCRPLASKTATKTDVNQAHNRGPHTHTNTYTTCGTYVLRGKPTQSNKLNTYT